MEGADKPLVHMRVQLYGLRKDTHSSSRLQWIYDQCCNSCGTLPERNEHGSIQLFFQKEQYKDYLGAFVTKPQALPLDWEGPWSLEIEIETLEPSLSMMKVTLDICGTCSRYPVLKELERSRRNCTMCDFLCRVFESCVPIDDLPESNENDDIKGEWYFQIWPLVMHWERGSEVLGWTEFDLLPRLADIPSRGLIIGSSEESIKIVSTWLRDCNCWNVNSNRPSHMPTRVLEISGSQASLCVRLLDTRDGSLSQQDFRYVALSHCWGPEGSPRLTTTDDNLQARRIIIPWATIPRTFQDAIVFTYQFGVRFLWIDSLCIIQDQHDLRDWRAESGKMADVYSHAYFTISAANAAHANKGLFRKVAPNALARPWIRLQDALSTGAEPLVLYAKRQLHCFEYDKESYPLLGRAWTYQERYLSPRTVFFFNNELVWVCKSATWKEKSNGNPCTRLEAFPKQYDTKGKPHPRDQWHMCVKEYSGLQMTFERDRLPAIQGIVTQMQCNREGRYFAGIWTDTFYYDLAWSPVGANQKMKTKRAPTWSWASAPGKVQFHFEPSSWSVQRIAKLLDIHYEYPSLDSTGERADGYLKLSGPSYRARDIQWECQENSSTPFGSNRWTLTLDYVTGQDNNLQCDIDLQSEEVILLQLCEMSTFHPGASSPHVIYFVLQKLQINNVWERVGLAFHNKTPVIELESLSCKHSDAPKEAYKLPSLILYPEAVFTII